MNECIRVFDGNSVEHARLTEAAKAIAQRTGLEAHVDDCMFDAGQDWRWTTILVRAPGRSDWCQCLDPAAQDRIVLSDPAGANEAIREIVKKLNRIFAEPIELYDPDDKKAVVDALAYVLARIPATKDVAVQYGVMESGRFEPMDCNAGPGHAEAIRITMPGQDPDEAAIQSIAGDSQVAVFHDMANRVANLMY